MKTHVLILSETFPKWHPRAGQPTYFKEKIYNAGVLLAEPLEYEMPANSKEPNVKPHTLRGNYDLWRKRFEKIDRGEACLVLKQWSGVPYRSKQETIAVLTKEDGIGLQMLEFSIFHTIIIDGKFRYDVKRDMLAMNDGLSYEDWEDWFKDCNISKPLAIIHFTNFRY